MTTNPNKKKRENGDKEKWLGLEDQEGLWFTHLSKKTQNKRWTVRFDRRVGGRAD